MKKKQKIFIIVVSVIAFLTSFSLRVIHYVDEYAYQEQYFIVFSNVEFDKTEQKDFIFVSYDEICEYKSEYAEYNQYTYYNQLQSEEDKIVYKIFEYALDHCYSNVFIDTRILGNSEYSNLDVFAFLSLDSAFVEQNNDNYGYEEVELTFTDKSRLKTNIFANVTGNVVNMEVFTQESIEKKEIAIKKAEEIAGALPKKLTDAEKAGIFYKYLQENIEYFDYKETDQEPNYLYDAFITGKTNCDGYANAFSMLCKLADIPCFEKLYIPPESTNDDSSDNDSSNVSEEDDEETTEELEGHTWNTVNLAGTWYNVDATYSDIYFEAEGVDKIYLYYGFSDKYQEYEHSYKELVPECKENLLSPDCTFKSFSDSDAISKMKDAFYKNDSKYILVFAEEAGDSYNNVMQRLANSLYKSIYHESYDGVFDKFYFIYPA